MKELDNVITNLNRCVKRYKSLSASNGLELNTLLKDISGYLYYLETVRADVHNEFEGYISELVTSGESVARATNMANVKYPAMYKLRCIMRSGYNVVDAIRTNISYLKSEKNSI